MADCAACMYGLGSNLENAEMELKAALRDRSYTGDYVKQVIGLRLFNTVNEKGGRWCEKKVRNTLKKALQFIARSRRDLSDTLGLEVGKVSVDPKLGIVDEYVVRDIYRFITEYTERNNFLFGSPEDIKVTVNALKREIPYYHNTHIVTVSIKDILRQDPYNFANAFWLTVRKKMLKMISKYVEDKRNYKNVSLYEMLRIGYGNSKECPNSSYGWSVNVGIVISDLEELFKLDQESIHSFLKMYELLVGSYSPRNLGEYLWSGYNAKIFPREQDKWLEVYTKDIRNTRFLCCGNKESLADLSKCNDKNSFPFVDRNHHIIS